MLKVARTVLATVLLGMSWAPANAQTATPPPTSTPYLTPLCAGGTRGGVSLDGINDYISVAHSASLNLTAGLSYIVWAKLDAPVGGELGGKWLDSVQEAWLVELTYDGTFFRARALVSEPLTHGRGVVFTFGLSVGDGGWHHYAFVFDGSQSGNSNRAKIYVDGLQQVTSSSGTIPSTLAVSTAPLEIGGNPSLSRYFPGMVDEPKLYNRALSAAEISDDFHAAAGTCSAASGLVGGWHLDDSRGTNAADYSGNSNTGTLMNGAAFTSAAFVCCPFTPTVTPTRRAAVGAAVAVIVGVVIALLLARARRPQRKAAGNA